MGGRTSRNKGRRGETAAKRLLGDHDYSTLADTTAGLATGDLLAQDAQGRIWHVEVKNCRNLMLPAWLAQARRQTKTGQHWMLLAHIHGTRSWLVLRQGMQVAVWHEHNHKRLSDEQNIRIHGQRQNTLWTGKALCEKSVF